MKRSFYLTLSVLMCLYGAQVLATEFKVAVRAHSGIEAAVTKWKPTVDYLNQVIPQHRFTLVPVISLSEINQAASRTEFDFIITNPSSYVEIEVKYGAARLLTLLNKRNQYSYDQFGSVIFSRMDNVAIKGAADFAGKRLVAVSPKAFGGWQVAQKEMMDAGVDPVDSFSQILFADGIQERVVEMVRDGKADVGVVRTDMLERMAGEGRIRLSDYRVLMQKSTPGFDFVHSTRLYPEWTFAKLSHTPLDIAKEVAIQLLLIKEDNVAAQSGKYTGWSVPKDYSPVHDLLRTLRAEPYTDFGKVSLREIIKTYWYVVLMAVFIVFGLIVFSIYVIHTNRRLEFAGKQLSIARDQLEEKVKERTQELEQEIERRVRVEEKLIHSRDVAERASEAKSQFLSSMSHELRTPLNAIIGFSQLLQINDSNNKLTENQQDNIHEIRTAGEHLLVLINEVLDLETIESGKLEVRLQEVDALPVINSCVKMLQETAKKRKLSISGNYAKHADRSLKADPQRLKQVLLNLVSNAIKYNKEGGSVSIDLERNQDRLLIHIKDTGIGIAAEDMNMLFQPFSRINAYAAGVDGTGIGLVLSKQLLALMGGEISVSSSLGEGSCFTITLPAK